MPGVSGEPALLQQRPLQAVQQRIHRLGQLRHLVPGAWHLELRVTVPDRERLGLPAQALDGPEGGTGEQPRPDAGQADPRGATDDQACAQPGQDGVLPGQTGARQHHPAGATAIGDGRRPDEPPRARQPTAVRNSTTCVRARVRWGRSSRGTRCGTWFAQHQLTVGREHLHESSMPGA